jgi:proteasome accessory factor B
MSARRTERLVNLVICLLSTRQYLTAARIRELVPGYGAVEDDRSREAFERMFERDKSELRDLGIPLEMGTNSIVDAEPGYRIARRDYELPDVHLGPDEAAAVGLAARLWRSAGLSSAASSALRKLRAAGIEVDEQGTLGVEPRVDAADPNLAPLLAAVRDRRPVRFSYRKAHAKVTEERQLEPWGVVSLRGRWYVVGHDRRRRATRCFRLSRVVGEVRQSGRPGSFEIPPGTDPTALVVASVTDPYDDMPSPLATVRVPPGRAAGLRRHASTSKPDGEYDRLEIPVFNPETFARWVAGYGADAVVVDPPEIRDAVIRRLRASAGLAGQREASTR